MVGYIVEAERETSMMWRRSCSIQAETLNMDRGVGLLCDYQRID